MRYKCNICDLYVFCDTTDECKKKCKDECKMQLNYVTPTSVENAFGPMINAYPENLKKMYDDTPNNQPQDYNMEVATTNPVNYGQTVQGLTKLKQKHSNIWR